MLRYGVTCSDATAVQVIFQLCS